MKRFKFKKIIASALAISMLLTYVPTVDVFAANTPTAGISSGEFNLNPPQITETNLAAGRADVKLDWDDYKVNVKGDEVSTDFYVARRPVNYANGTTSYGDWEIRGKYGKQIKVLNIYPDRSDSAGLKNWMSTQSAANENVDIVVDTQSLSDFNKNPYGKLKKATDGSYNYDVIVFGFWDSTNYAKISSGSTQIIQDFIDAGYGVIFGHDTIQHTGTSLGFNNLVQDNLDLIITTSDKSKRWFYSDKISVKKQGAVTTYPFDINGKDLLIPMSHSVGQLPGNTKTGEPNNDIVYMTFEPNYYPSTGDGPYFSYNVNGGPKGPSGTVTYNYNGKGTKEYIGNAYLVKDGNVAFIQCGHSSGKTNPPEQMLLANLIYSIAQINHGESNANDQVLDEISPDVPTMNLNNPNSPDYTFNSKDHGIGYEYRIIAFPQGYKLSEVDENGLQTALSGENSKFNDSVVFSNSYLTGELISELKGSAGYENEIDHATYRYYIDNTPVGSRIPPVEIDGNENQDDDFYSLGYGDPFDYSIHYTTISDIAPNDYLHVVAYDRANNASKVADFRVLDVLPQVDASVEYYYDNENDDIDPVFISPGAEYDDGDGDGIVKYEYSDSTYQYVDSNFSVKIIPDFIRDGKNYVFSHSEDFNGNTIDPASIVLKEDANENVIRQIYDKLVTKDIYLVDDRTALGDSTKMTAYNYTTVTLKEGETLDINSVSPDLTDENYTYEGWSTLTKTTPNLNTTIENAPTAGANYTMVDDGDAVYIYYKKDIADVKIDVVRDLDGTESGTATKKIGTYSVKGFVGDTVDVTGSDIKRNITLNGSENLNNLTCYTNYTDLNRYHEKFLFKDTSHVNDTITLIPRSKYVTYYGINYDEVTLPIGGATSTTSQSAISVSGGKSAVYPNLVTNGPYIFDPTVNKNGKGEHIAPKTYGTPDAIGEVWKNMTTSGSADETVSLNFANDIKVHVGYFKGTELDERFYITTTYKNVIDSKEILAPVKSPFLSVKDNTLKPSDIVDVPEISDISKNYDDTNITSDGRLVDFEVDHFEVSHDNKLIGSYKTMTEVDNAIPIDDSLTSIGEYKLDVYYRPYSTVHYTKKVYGFDRTTEVSSNEIDFDELYDGITHSRNTVIMPNYTVDVTSKDTSVLYEHGTLHDTISFDVNAYDIYITGKFYPNTYNLIVNVINDSASARTREYAAYTFANVPAASKTQFNIPNVKGFEYISTDAVIGTNSTYITESNTTTDGVVTNTIAFKPLASEVNETGTKEYAINVHYAQKAVLDVTYIVVSQNGKVVKSIQDTTHHVGDEINFKIPDGEANGYNLVLGYLDGVLYNDGFADTAGETLTTTVSKPKQHLYLVYAEQKYKLTVENATGEETGKAVGGGEFYKGKPATISAIPASGYTFSGWTFNPSTVTASNPNSDGEQTIIMPAQEVIATARFILTDAGGNGGDGGGNGGDGDGEDIDTTNPIVTKPVEPEKPIVPEKPIFPEKPVPPVKPEKPTINDIHNLVDDPYYKLIREYSIYIHGYPDDNIHPADSITRAEVMAVIYNLYGNGYISDEQSLARFNDTDSGDWYSQAIAFCVDFGIVNGYSNGTMEPNEPISRAELAAILAKFVVAKNVATSPANFSDVKVGWVKSSIDTLYSNGIVAGYQDGTFKPNAETKRSEFVVMVNRLIKRPEEYKEEKTFPDLPKTHWAYDDMMNASNGVVVGQDLPDYILENIKN